MKIHKRKNINEYITEQRCPAKTVISRFGRVSIAAFMAAIFALTGFGVLAAEQLSGSASDSDVTATITLDKNEYSAGDSIGWTLEICNERAYWGIDGVAIKVTNSDGIESAEEIPEYIDNESGDTTITLSGSFTADAEIYTGESVISKVTDVTDGASSSSGHTAAYIAAAVVILIIAAAGIFAFRRKKGVGLVILAAGAALLTGGREVYAITGSETLTLRPYVKFDYVGQEAMVRMVLDIDMTPEKAEVSDEDKADIETTSCHDPSIFKDTDGTYYVFGTHMGLSKSTDLINWTNMDAEFRSSFSEETKEQILSYNKDEGTTNWFDYLWAPDVIYNEELGKYCMYLSANGDDWVSNIVMLTADSVTGPYEYAGTVVYGGFTSSNYSSTDVMQVTGESSVPERYITNGVENKKWGDEYPNCIDPCVFYDEEGVLWMSYGSWSGGIFMLKIDSSTGLRDYSVTYDTNEHSDAYFGTKIAGGKYVSGEGSYIQHIGDYYYLFISYGGLVSNGGYNIRVFRSTEPDGGYVDENGNTPYYDTYVLNINSSEGIRLFGGYKWRTFRTGQVAQGHNSAFVDDDGKAYIIYHTRITDGSESHYVKVHQLFVNEDGWLVAAPYAYSGESLDDSISMEDVAGSYETIIHELDIDYENREVATPQSMVLNEDGTITGAYSGTWSAYGSNITLNIDGEEYKGVVFRMNIEDTTLETTVFTVLGTTNQLTLWGSMER